MEIAKTFEPKSRQEWRDWLAKNYKLEKEIWLVRYKKSTGKQALNYDDCIEEALCFGWIDSTEKSIDESRFALRFTPRRLNSNWSEINKKRLEELKKKGLMVV